MLGLVGGAVLDIYSSGLALLAARPAACRATSPPLIDGVIMIAGTVYVVFFADDFLGPFQGFLITLGVPIAAWCGIMLADIAAAPRATTPRPTSSTRAAATATSGWLPVCTSSLRHRARLGPGHQHVRRAG